MSRLRTLWNILGHYKLLLTFIIGVVLVGVVSETSVVNLLKLDAMKKNLQGEVDYYRRQTQEAKRDLELLRSSHRAVERVAREQYFMKCSDEDVFVLSTSLPTDNSNLDEDYGE